MPHVPKLLDMPMFCFAGLAGVCVPAIKFLLHIDANPLFTFARLTKLNLFVPSHKMACFLYLRSLLLISKLTRLPSW